MNFYSSNFVGWDILNGSLCTSEIHNDIVYLEILSRYCGERYKSPLARNLKVHANLSWNGSAFWSRLSNFCAILRAIILRISSNNVELDIRKKIWKPAQEWCSKLSRFWSLSIRSAMKSVALYFFLPCRRLGQTQNQRRRLFMSRATFIALEITIKVAEAARTSSSSHIFANNWRKSDEWKETQDEMLSFVQIGCINVDVTSCATVSFNFCHATSLMKSNDKSWMAGLSVDTALSTYSSHSDLTQ